MKKCFEEDDTYERDDTPMICAARGCPDVPGATPKHVATLEIVLLYGGDVNAYNKVHQTPLYVAVQKGYLNIAAWLIVNGANVDICDSVGVSPLLLAARLGRADLVTLLLDSKARVAALRRRASCLKVGSNDWNVKRCIFVAFTPEIQALLATALQKEAEANASRMAAQRSKDTRAHMEQLKGQLQQVREATRRANVEARLLEAHTKAHTPVFSATPTPSLADHFRSSPALNRIHSAPTEWTFVTADFSSSASLHEHDLLHSSTELYASLKRRRERTADPRNIQSAPEVATLRRNALATVRPHTTIAVQTRQR
ncbi:hypothetical protein SPRG_01032 [Saprolegnia parasitica CBS 223.65]|uniref:Uncharacterized protein n=1 Tax=Saprolegnia parasitica (strain CBS 223.65) TaxID=695850 RepID=A0A067D0C0_SAPPC|nr:hypothetical protein SPRG_01032 [Saprolegnia parasitica CBS 223.65]KDO34970.1 hypothetical protein SPRG_01032 [Saprolegnia parasitica CBS 223.65]|eukprot:XP_012194624.1 hypothetical protein SPRG_01032 [Saprolegnia parasitica CBS 223.65]